MTQAKHTVQPVPVRFGVRLFERAGMLPALLCLGFAILSFALQAFRITLAPDLLGDEASYAFVGKSIAAGLGMRQFGGGIFLWHPPLYMLIEAAWLRIFGLVGADPVATIFHLRLINALASGTTAGLLFSIGHRLRGRLTGSCMALLFCLDPYVQRINRRSMLETVAALFVVLGVYLYLFTLQSRRHWLRDGLPVGISFGLALLTKEVMIFALAIPFLFTFFYRHDHIRRAILVAGVALTTYAIYPLLLFLSGNWYAYQDMKQSEALRLLGGLVGHAPVSGLHVTASKVSLLQSIAVLLPQYLFSYVVIVVAVGIAVWIFFRHRNAEEGLIVTWAAATYGFIGFGLVFGRISDQFFYYIVIPAIVLLGYAISRLIEELWDLWQRIPWHASATPKHPHVGMGTIARTACLAVALAGLIWNLGVYVRLFVVGQDNSFAMLHRYVNQNIPEGTTMVFGADIANYILPNYRIRFNRDAVSLQNDKIRYVVLSSKERWGGYAKVTPEFYDWVASNSRVLFHQYGTSFWDLELFEIRQPGAQR